MYRQLDSEKIVQTLEILERRITDRFEGSGLSKVCAELTAIAHQTQERSAEIARPDNRLRILVGGLLLLGLFLLLQLALSLLAATKVSNELFGVLEGIDSAFNIIVLMGASLFFLVTLEERVKRKRALDALHELRSIIHVIDMHQLTKDPSTEVSISQMTDSSPKRTLHSYELLRYLDYCTEMLSLASKVAVLYSQSFPDPIVTEAVNDLERTASSLSQKIWQKINIMHRSLDIKRTPEVVSFEAMTASSPQDPQDGGPDAA